MLRVGITLLRHNFDSCWHNCAPCRHNFALHWHNCAPPWHNFALHWHNFALRRHNTAPRWPDFALFPGFCTALGPFAIPSLTLLAWSPRLREYPLTRLLSHRPSFVIMKSCLQEKTVQLLCLLSPPPPPLVILLQNNPGHPLLLPPNCHFPRDNCERKPWPPLCLSTPATCR